MRGRGESLAPHFLYTQQMPIRLSAQFLGTIVPIFALVMFDSETALES
jgi:hypothetical protein